MSGVSESPTNRADASGEAGRPTIRGTRHACVAGHYLAAHAGYAVLEAGGNAIDAGVAAGIAEAVVQSEQVNFAGIAPCMIFLARTGEVVTIAGVGTWPRAASRETFERRYDGRIPRGVLRTVVPAAPAAWVLALRRYGTMTFADVAEAAIRFAGEGFPIHPYNAEQIRRNADEYREWPANAAVYLPGGRPPEPGERFVQADLARTMRYLADEERAAASGGRDAGLRAVHDAFYRGDVARAIVDYHRDHGGWLASEDLASFAVEVASPARGRFRGMDVCTCGFWSQGPALIQMLHLIEDLDLGAAGHNSPRFLHLLVEAVKLAFADRHAYYGDPRVVAVPEHELLSAAYARARRGLLDPARAWPGLPPPGDLCTGTATREAMNPAARPGAAAPAATEPSDLDTTYCCAVDRHGNVFSASPSDTSTDTPIIPGTGLCPSARGAQSWVQGDHPNCVAPGKRPRVTPNPVMLLRDGRPALAMGTPGGDLQPQAVLQALLNITEFRMTPQNAVEAPRFVSWSFPNSREPHAYHAGLLALESRIPREVGDALAERGHRIAWWPERTGRAGGVCVIRFDPRTKIFEAAADCRRAGYALGW
jgi:gamma-glutamyltranspeptidase/glutathione hydrolase